MEIVGVKFKIFNKKNFWNVVPKKIIIFSHFNSKKLFLPAY
jgi:hypothetical protein